MRDIDDARNADDNRLWNAFHGDEEIRERDDGARQDEAYEEWIQEQLDAE